MGDVRGAHSNSFDAQSPVSINRVLATPAAGAQAAMSTNALRQSETKRYDLRFGTMVGLTGPNGLPTTWQVDDDGRKLREVRADGAGTRSESCLLPGRASDTSSNAAACAGGIPAEAPGDEVLYVESVSLDTAGNVNGPFQRVYKDWLGHFLSVACRAIY